MSQDCGATEKRDRPATPWIVAAILIAASFVAAVVSLINGGGADSVVFGPPLTALFSVVGAIVATHQQGRRVAWLLFPIGIGVHATAIVDLFVIHPPVAPASATSQPSPSPKSCGCSSSFLSFSCCTSFRRVAC